MTRQGSIAALAPYNDHLLPTISYECSPLGHLDKHSLSMQPSLHSTVPNSIYLPIITVKPSTHELIDRLIFELSSHPNHSFVKTLIDNLTHGCPIGYKGPHFARISRNLPSAFQQPDILDAALATECAVGHILGPYYNPPLPNQRCSGLGLTPKHDGGWCTIYHLSAPSNRSIN